MTDYEQAYRDLRAAVGALADEKDARIAEINATPDPLTGRCSTMRAFVLTDELRAVLATPTTTEQPQCDHPGIEHGPASATGVCPRCRRCKFIGHGPLCGDCLVEATITEGD